MKSGVQLTTRLQSIYKTLFIAFAINMLITFLIIKPTLCVTEKSKYLSVVDGIKLA